MRMHWQVRFIVPGSMVCNLDFVESIFVNGNAIGTAQAGCWLVPLPFVCTLRTKAL